MSISDRIKLVRKQLRMEQVEISTLLGIPLRSYGKYERGENKPGLLAVNKFSNIGINTNWLLTGEGEMFLSNDNKVIPTTPQQQNSKVDKIDTEFLLLCHYAISEHYGVQYNFQTPATQIEYCGKLANEVAGFNPNLDPTLPNCLTVEDLVNFIKFLIKVGRLPVEFAYDS